MLAVKTTLSPAHIGPAGAATILIVGTTVGFTIITILFEVSVAGAAQTALEVKIQVTIFPFAKVVDEYVFELIPTFTPFTCHW